MAKTTSTTASTGAADSHIVGRATQRALARHQEAYHDEVRRLLDAGLEVMRRLGTTKSPRVADILEHAGLSRDAFYRHFASKEDLVAAIVEAGAWRLASYVSHRMDKAGAAPEARIRAWIEAVMSQATDPDVARTTRAVLWNGGHLSQALAPFDSNALLSELLVDPIGELPGRDPARDAVVVGHAVMGRMSAAVALAQVPSDEDVEHLVDFCLSGLGVAPARRPGRRRR